MGIKNGAPIIIKHLRRGLYFKDAQVYNIYVDGELMRYRGMIEANLCKNNAEEAIAITSFDYLKSTINKIHELMGRRSRYIKVMMDGARVANKETNRAKVNHDVHLIRRLFKHYCSVENYSVLELHHGESELQMYLQRDQTSELNIFLTNDSDMISICYGHTPVLNEKFDSLEDSVLHNRCYAEAIDDCNLSYPKNIKVLDSCMWINCGRSVEAIGFDFIADRLVFEPKIFRTFIACCKTDFTEGLFCDSMVDGIMKASDADKKFINTLSDINEIAAALQLIGLRNNGLIKRDSFKPNAKFKPDDISRAILMYIQYIETGYMPCDTMPRNDMSLACRHYLYAMRQQDDCFVLKSLRTWAKSIDIKEAISNMNECLGSFVPKERILKRKKVNVN